MGKKVTVVDLNEYVEPFSAVWAEHQNRKDLELAIKRQIEFSTARCAESAELREQLPSVKEWLESMIKMLQAEAETIRNKGLVDTIT